MSEFAPGDRVALYRPTGWHADYRLATVARVTKTQYVLEGGRKFRKEDGREVGVDRYRSEQILRTDDPLIVEVAKERERRDLVNATHAAFDEWRTDRRQTPTDLAKAARALVDYDAKVAGDE